MRFDTIFIHSSLCTSFSHCRASMISLRPHESQSIVGDHVSEVATPGVVPGEISPAVSVAELVRGGVWMLVRDPAFLALCLGSALIQLGCMVPIFFIADYMETLGHSRDRAAVLIAIFGKTFDRADETSLKSGELLGQPRRA